MRGAEGDGVVCRLKAGLAILPGTAFLALVVLLCGCVYIQTKSGKTNYNRSIEITATAGKVFIDISGYISEDIYVHDDVYANNRNKYTDNIITVDNTMKTIIVAQGKETIKKQIILGETQSFKYTLTTAEAVIINIKSVDDNDAIITVFEYGQSREHKIDGKNKFGQTISFVN
jgi:hypothetical protein